MRLEPFYFGEPDAQLFGCHHPARTPHLQKTALICPSIGEEYIACHRALRQLSVRLAQAGVASLRFDYFATGDSAGASEEGSPARWLRDIAGADRELERRHPGAARCLIGFRAGASLALLHRAHASSTDPVVLWDPLLDGSELEAIGLLSVEPAAIGPILLVETDPRGDAKRLESALRARKSRVDYQILETPPIWEEQPDNAVVPQKVIQSIVSWIKAI